MKAAKPKIGVRSQESGEKIQKEEVRSQKKCFYKYERLPSNVGDLRDLTGGGFASNYVGDLRDLTDGKRWNNSPITNSSITN
ncbi:hypothetical protein [Microcoleus sp. D2_18a_B4]|uniref:hypothetical protein n=1 Tax=Microcoleus sp. D2_18a_B4 TaxID=3055329 RepID=UPI002FD4E4F2